MTVTVTSNHPCVGCSYCCRVAQCPAGVAHYGYRRTCPGLVPVDGRYRCDLVLTGKVSHEDLAIGAGCSSPLFNTVRDAMLAKGGRP